MRFEECRRAVEFRATDTKENDGHTLEGYAAVFGQDTEINSWEGKFTERIDKGAFKKTLRERKPIMQYDHGRDSRVGSVPIGVYEELREDDHGLYVKGRVFDNDVVEPVRQAIEGGAISGMSFKFRVTRDTWRDNAGRTVRGDEIMKLLYEPGERGPLVRTIKEVQLSEAGPVASPAYAGTSVGMRSLAEMTDADREELAAEYRKTMIEEAEDDYERDQAERFPEGELQRWLDAEQEFNTKTWLDAEKRYNDDVSAWLEAEERFGASIESEKHQPSDDDAGRKTTSRAGDSASPSIPEADAARTGTSSRDSKNTPLKKKGKSMTLDELRTRLAEIDARFEELGEESRDAEMPEEAQTEWDGLESERAKVEKSIERIEQRMERIAKLSETPGHSERGYDRAPSFRKSEDNIYHLDEIRKESFSGDDFIERATDAAKRGLEKVHLPYQADSRAKEKIEEMLANDSESGYVAKRMVATGSPEYERAFGKALKAGSLDGLTLDERRTIDEARAIAVGTDAAGNFAVPFQLDPTLVHLGAGYISPLRQLAKVVQLFGKEYQTLTISQIAVYRALEAAIAVDSSPTLAQQVLRVNKVHGFVPFSMEADEDWAGMRAEVFQLLQEAKDREEATAFMFGTGVAPQPQGLYTGTTNTVAAGSGLKITAADIYNLMDNLPVEYEANASFLATKQTFNKIRQMDNTTAGRNSESIWGPNLEAGAPTRLLDTPVYRVTDIPVVPGGPTYDDAPLMTFVNGNKVLFYGDVRRAFTILDRVGMSVELVPMLFASVNPGAFAAGATVAPMPTGQRGFYAHWRNNSKVVDPNAIRALTATT